MRKIKMIEYDSRVSIVFTSIYMLSNIYSLAS